MCAALWRSRLSRARRVCSGVSSVVRMTVLRPPRMRKTQAGGCSELMVNVLFWRISRCSCEGQQTGPKNRWPQPVRVAERIHGDGACLREKWEVVAALVVAVPDMPYWPCISTRARTPTWMTNGLCTKASDAIDPMLTRLFPVAFRAVMRVSSGQGTWQGWPGPETRIDERRIKEIRWVVSLNGPSAPCCVLSFFLLLVSFLFFLFTLVFWPFGCAAVVVFAVGVPSVWFECKGLSSCWRTKAYTLQSLRSLFHLGATELANSDDPDDPDDPAQPTEPGASKGLLWGSQAEMSKGPTDT